MQLVLLAREQRVEVEEREELETGRQLTEEVLVFWLAVTLADSLVVTGIEDILVLSLSKELDLLSAYSSSLIVHRRGLPREGASVIIF